MAAFGTWSNGCCNRSFVGSDGGPSFPGDRFALWIEPRTDVRLIERRPMPPLGHFSLLRFVSASRGRAHEHHRRQIFVAAERSLMIFADVNPFEFSR